MEASISIRSIEDKQPKGQWINFYYDRKAANRAVKFIEKQLVHVEGKHAGEPFLLEWWEKKLILKFFGWKRRDNNARRFRVLFIFVPRKNGKSALAAAIALYLMFADKEPAAQVVCAAADKNQAGIIFNMASNMVVANDTLGSMAKVYKASIFAPQTNSALKVLSKKPNTKHGANLHGVLADEVHAIEDRELIDVLTTGTIARKQPVVVFTSTAGFDKTHFFYGLYCYAKTVAADPSKDETWLTAIYEADPENWKDPKEWIRANPNFGVTMDMESFEQDFRIALEVPAYENTFKRLRLNIWTEQDTRAIPMDKWALCYKPEAKIEELLGKTCYAGMDLASTTDLASLSLVFPPFGDRDFFDVLMFYWFPEGNYKQRMKKLGAVDIMPWNKSNHLTFTEGEVIDYDLIRAKFNELGKLYKIKEIAIDRWNATQLSTQLDNDGFTVVPTGQGFATMSDPTKFMLGLVLQGRLNHRNNPVLEWNARNFCTEEDAAGNLKPSKKKAKEKIDGCVSLVMALGRANANQPKMSAYANRGVRVIG